MSALGYILILFAALMIRGLVKGRNLDEIPDDLADLVRAVILGRYKDVDVVLMRTGEGMDPVKPYVPPSGFAPDAGSGGGGGGGGGGGWSNPVSGRQTSAYGTQRRGYAHAGTDIAAPMGSPVRAAGPGTVVFTGTAGSDPLTKGRTGLAIVVRHVVGDTYYGHLSAIDVRKGQSVSGGQVIGKVGSTGRNSTGPHLHFEYRPVHGSTSTVDPGKWLAGLGVKLGA